MSPGRTLIFAHLFLRHRPEICPRLWMLCAIFFKSPGAMEGTGKRGKGSRRERWMNFCMRREFSCLRNKKLMRKATALYLVSTAPANPLRNDGERSYWPFWNWVRRKFNASCWSRSFSYRGRHYETHVICHREATAIFSRMIGKRFTVEYMYIYTHTYTNTSS